MLTRSGRHRVHDKPTLQHRHAHTERQQQNKLPLAPFRAFRLAHLGERARQHRLCNQHPTACRGHLEGYGRNQRIFRHLPLWHPHRKGSAHQRLPRWHILPDTHHSLHRLCNPPQRICHHQLSIRRTPAARTASAARKAIKQEIRKKAESTLS